MKHRTRVSSGVLANCVSIRTSRNRVKCAKATDYLDCLSPAGRRNIHLLALIHDLLIHTEGYSECCAMIPGRGLLQKQTLQESLRTYRFSLL